MAEELQKAGVELVVENLGKFLTDLNKSSKGLALFKSSAEGVKKGLEAIKP